MIRLVEGDLLVLTADLVPTVPPGPGEVPRIGCTLPEAIDALHIGHRVDTDHGAGEVVLRVVRTRPGGGRSGPRRASTCPTLLSTSEPSPRPTTLPELLVAAMRVERVGVMIARGDLAVEAGFARTAES